MTQVTIQYKKGIFCVLWAATDSIKEAENSARWDHGSYVWKPGSLGLPVGQPRGICGALVVETNSFKFGTSHDLTPNGGLVREIPLFQGNSRLARDLPTSGSRSDWCNGKGKFKVVKYYNLARFMKLIIVLR